MAIYHAIGTEDGHLVPGLGKFRTHAEAYRAARTLATTQPNIYGDSLFVLRVTTQVVSNRVSV